MSDSLDPIKSEEENEFFEHFKIEVDKNQSLLRIDKFLMNRIENATRNKIQNAAKAGNILVNKQNVKSNYKVKPGDIISVVLSHPPREVEVIPQDIPLDIRYEDENLLFVYKPAGMVVHPAHGNYDGTLLNALTFHFRKGRESEEIFPFLTHRIDKDTSGILVVSKDDVTQSKLAKLFFDHNVKRKYIALVWGDMKEDEGTISGNIARSKKDRRIYQVYEEGGRHAVTHYKVLKKYRYVTLVECSLETGRTHQIRVHFKHIGHPLFGDKTYGGDQIIKGTTFTKYKQFIENCFKILPRQALHAKSLGFKHPVTKKDIFIDTELPEDFKEVLLKWEVYTNSVKE